MSQVGGRQDLKKVSIKTHSMKCLKCDEELEPDSRFCGNCGEKVNESKVDLDKTFFDAAKVWYIIGWLRSGFIDKKDKESLKILEDKLKKCEVFEVYSKVVSYWKDSNKIDNGKIKKTKSLGEDKLKKESH